MKMPVERQIKVNSVMLTIFEWGRKEQDTILLIHATGFHARCWDQVIMGLGDRHIIAVDMRGHGRSQKMAPYDWTTFGEDVSSLVETMDLNSVVGVGHSMGGHSITYAAGKAQDRFRRLVLVDPVIMPPEFYASHNVMKEMFPEGHPVLKRRQQFTNADAMFTNFAGRGSYASWQPAALHDYCDYGLLPDGSGDGFVLACPPDVEAAIYMANAGSDVHDLVRSITIPVKVLRAKQRTAERDSTMDFSTSPTWPELAQQFQRGEDIYLPELTHFIPMQAPDLVARHILGEASGINEC